MFYIHCSFLWFAFLIFNILRYLATVLLATKKSFIINFSTISESERGLSLSSFSIILEIIYFNSLEDETSPEFFINALENKLFKLTSPMGESIYLFLITLLMLEISFSIFFAISSNFKGFKNSDFSDK